MIRNHSFVDGNKWVAIMAAAFWLEREGFVLDAAEDDLYQTTMQTAQGRLGVEPLAGWLEANSSSAG